MVSELQFTESLPDEFLESSHDVWFEPGLAVITDGHWTAAVFSDLITEEFTLRKHRESHVPKPEGLRLTPHVRRVPHGYDVDAAALAKLVAAVPRASMRDGLFISFDCALPYLAVDSAAGDDLVCPKALREATQLLGRDFLRTSTATIDLATRRLFLRSPDARLVAIVPLLNIE